ncbi:MAG: hypothetical protein KJO67_02895 [Silicimonas sp.]|nr:hypothetical protein [Silicimonas sp.]NNL35882.1 hypothetical protein [Silicimonas sp.]
MPDPDTEPAVLRHLPFVVTPREMHKFVGAISLGLPLVLLAIAAATPICFMQSISHYYYTPLGGDVLVGGLTVIAAIMIYFYQYKGDEGDENSAYNLRNARLAKLAGLFALGVAFLPTSGAGCPFKQNAARFLVPDTTLDTERLPVGALSSDFWAIFVSDTRLSGLLGWLHYLSALGMFLILGYFSYFVFTRVQTRAATETHSMAGELTPSKKLRNRIYRIAGIAIALSILALAVKFALAQFILPTDRRSAFEAWWNGWHLTFLFEAVALMAFGVSWLVKARILAVLEDQAA